MKYLPRASAFGKLQGLIKRSVRFAGQNYVNLVIMATTLVVPKSGQADHREPWEIVREAPEHVDFVTNDLGGFLALAAPPPPPTPPPAAR